MNDLGKAEEVSMNPEVLTNKLTAWIRDYVLTSECVGVVFGMSGGLDSSVVAILCRSALPLGSLGLIMPCHSNPEDEEHAGTVAGLFDVATKVVNLDDVHDSMLSMLPDGDRMAEANLKARLRMLTLYYFANSLNYVVVGSSNRSELFVGYFTKHGDGGTDIMPLGKLVKGQVRELASFLGIPQVIIDKQPSGGLWPGQTDEGELGFSYNDLDSYLLSSFVPSTVKKRIEQLRASAKHKLSMPPIFENKRR